MKVRSRSQSKPSIALVEDVIDSAADIRAGIRHLVRVCPVAAAMHARTGDPPLRRHPGDFSGLARIVVGQQLSIASAAAIWKRCETTLGSVTAASLSAATEDALKAAGLSRPKVRTMKALADAVGSGALDLDRLRTASDDEIHAALTSVSGIGPWTADIFVMFCLGRRDAWAAGDLALQTGVASAFGLGARVSALETLEIAERWRPWRGVAARLVWADYAHLRAGRPSREAPAAATIGSGRRDRPGSRTRPQKSKFEKDCKS